MAFSTAQEQYIKSIVGASLTQFPNGYYVAWNTPTTESNKYDLHIILSDTLIFSSDSHINDFFNGTLTLSFRGYPIRYDIITSNPSGYNPDLSSRVVVSDFSYLPDPTKFDLDFDLSNTISTNAEFTERGWFFLPVGDIFSTSLTYINSDFRNFDYFKTDIVFSIFLIVVVLFVNFRSHFKFKFRK